ncbi:MAG: RHS repeat protein [Pyrinomonadaceae bacterium]|nr:RHS repeat protein [Pyrinomonadaceae bacterium]
MNSSIHKVSRTIKSAFSNKLRFSIIRCEVDPRQILASFMISALLLPIFSLPVQARFVPGANNLEFEPVNEELSVLTSIWRALNSRLEEMATPLRSSNIAYENSLNPSNTGIENRKSNLESPNSLPSRLGDEWNTKKDDENERSREGKVQSLHTNPEISDHSTDTNKMTSGKSADHGFGTRPSLPMFNQLPEVERDTIYTAQNNLGTPPGQVEMDSMNQAAAIRVRHRAGTANFSFGLPLASLSGRGIDAGVGMTYNSRTWNKSCTQFDTNNWPNCVSGYEHFTYDVDQSWVAPGFTTGFGYIESSAEIRNVIVDPPNNNWQTEITPLGLTDPDGTRHQFACTATTPIPGTFQSRCTRYSTSDGTRIEVAGKAYTDNPNNSPYPYTANYPSAYWETTLPGGTKVWYTGGNGTGESRKHYPYKIRDRNGNILRITYKNDQSGRIDYITDTLNRLIKFYYENDSNGNPDKLIAISIPGLGTNEEIQTVRFYYETVALNSAGKFTGQITAPSSIRVLRWVFMPSTKTAFKYEYNSNYGMIKKIERRVGVTVSDPTSTTAMGSVTNEGAWAASTEYNYPDGTTALSDVPKYSKRTDDWYGKTSSIPAETYYDVPEPSGGIQISRITVVDSNFNIETETKANAATGMIMESSIKKIWGPAGQYTTLMAKNEYTWSANRNLTKLETTNESGLKKKTEFEYDQYNNQTLIKEYDYYPSSGSPALLRTTEMTYETGSGWINKNLTGLVKSVRSIVNNVTVSKSLFEYDHNGNDSTLTHRDDINIATHDTYYNPAHPAWDEEICPYSSGSECTIIHHDGYDSTSAYRGNLTKVTGFADATLTTDANADVTDYNYDIAGNTVSATLSCCQLKTIAYDKANEYAFPISETKGSSPQLTSSATYNRNTGLTLTTTNENGQVTTYEYETDTLRPKKTILPNGGYTETEYSDKLISNPNDLLPGFVRQTTTLETNKFAQSYSYFDGRGLGIRSATQTPDGWSIAAAEYDQLGRPRKSYNPFYGSTPTAAIPSATKYSEMTGIDALGRTTSVKLQDDTTVTTEYSSVSTRPASFLSTFVTATDQAGKKRRQVIDSLGRIVRVDEPDASGNLGAVDASLPAQQTFYEYDGNDNLSKVIQSDGTVTQERKFKYDSLSRLTHERQVEANPTLDDAGIKGTPDPNKWTKVLKYNLDGLLSEGIDARGVKTSISYDGLNRIQSVTYTGETGYQTPNVTYTYDQARSGYFNAGALTRVETAAVGDTPATATEFDYDLMGRARKHRQWIAGQQYDLEYTYNLAGQLTSEKYPSGRIMTMGYDANGRMSSISDANRTYLSGLQYQQIGGAVSALTLGNGIQQAFEYNDRLQMKKIAWTKNNSVIQRYDYSFGQIDPQSGSVDTTKNNGQLAQVESYIGGTASSPTKQFTQKFSYDSIGRLEKENEYRGDDGNQVYQQKFSFDRFGNRYLKASENPSNHNPLAPTPIEDNNIERATNRFAANTGTVYDDAGNVVLDDKFREMDFVYDANGRMAKATRANFPEALSVFDAGGNKVATRVNDVWRFQIYDAGGKCVAEYGGPQSADDGGVKYTHQDIQGSIRTISTQAGFAQARMDYQAFGEQISSSIGQRTSTGYTTSDTLRNRYAMTERDEATGLDDTWFRKLENRAGRWTSPDPYNGSANIGNGQSWNRYSYVENQPTNFVDPSGLLALSWVCWDLNTYFSNANGDQLTRTTTQCSAIWVGGGDGGGGNSGATYGGGSDEAQTRTTVQSSKKKPNLKNAKEALDKCIRKLFGVSLTSFNASDRGKNGSVTVNFTDPARRLNGLTGFGVVNDVSSYSIKTAPEDVRNQEGKNSKVYGFTNSGSPYTNYTLSNITNSMDILKTQIHELGHSLQYIAMNAVSGYKQYGEAGWELENCVRDNGGFK